MHVSAGKEMFEEAKKILGMLWEAGDGQENTPGKAGNTDMLLEELPKYQRPL